MNKGYRRRIKWTRRFSKVGDQCLSQNILLKVKRKDEGIMNILVLED